MRLIYILTLLIVTSCSNTIKVYEKYKLPTTEDVVMYQINPRVFAPEKSFLAIENYADSIKSLGVNIVWFMPINEVGKENSVNSPYCVKDYKNVNPEFGTLYEFKHLVNVFHDKNIGVIIDWVANHTSWDNSWIVNKEWYSHDADGNITSPENTGWYDVADLNYDNNEMRLEMIESMKFWSDSIGVDGFRCDAADMVPFDFWKQAIDSLRKTNDNLLILAEGKRKDHFYAGFDMNYAWDYIDAMRNVFVNDSSACLLFSTDKAEYDSIPSGKVKLRFTTNHDEMVKKSPVVEFTDERGSMAAFVASVYLHGGALIYSSQEIGYKDTIDFFKYCSMDWSSNQQLRNEYKKIISVYNKYDAIRKGELVAYPDDNVLLFEKKDACSTILVAVNLRNEAEEIEVPSSWSNVEYCSLMGCDKMSLDRNLVLSPYEYLILKK